jgi:RHS repeat-associated protein
LLNARGYSSPIAPQAALRAAAASAGSATTLPGSQSYNYTIPILRLPGRAGMDLVLNLYYNSRIWDVDTASGTVTFNADRDFPSYGFRLDFGFIEYNANSSQAILTEGDGSKHAMTQVGSNFFSSDGTFMRFNRQSFVLAHRNGTTIQYLPFPSNTNFYRPTKVKDTNGNYISISYLSGHDQLISTVTDTVGRVITFNYDSSNRLTSLTQATTSGTKTYATFAWDTIYGGGYAWYNFSGLIAKGTPDLNTPLNVVTKCTYANGMAYRFNYGDWGIVKKIENVGSGSSPATRSYVSYNYPSAASPQTDAPTYTEQTVSPDGGTGNLSTWTYTATKNGTGVVTSMAITDPSGAKAITNLDPTTGQLSSVQMKDASGALVRTVSYIWSGNRLLSATTTFEDTGQQSSVQYEWDFNGNPTTVSEYDFGSVLKRQTVTTYAGGAYITQHIFNLPTQVLIKDGAGNVVSRTDLAYDSTTLTQIDDAAGHDSAFNASYSTRGNLTSVTRSADAATPSGGVTRTFNYDTLGNQITAQMDCCNQKTFNFSIATQYSAPDSIVRGLISGTHFTTSYTYNVDNNLLLSSTDENSQVTNYQYDSMDRTRQVLLPPQAPNGTRVQVNTDFDDVATAPTVTRSTTANSAVSVTTLDGLGHVMQVDNKNASTLVSSVKYEYDRLWQRTKASNPFAPGETVVNTIFDYDALGRVKKVTPPSGGYTQYSYSGNVVTITDPAGKQRKNITDALGRLAEVDEPGETFAGTASSGSLNIGGPLRSQSGVGAAPGTATIALSGNNACTPDFSLCDSGLIQTTVHGFPDGTPYPNGDPVGFLAQYLTNTINQDNPYVSASWNNNFYSPVITLQAKTSGSNTNYSLSTLVYSYDPTDFPVPGYSMTASGPALTGGSDGVTVWDSGTVTVTIGNTGFTASASYSHTGNSTAALVVAALVGSGPTGLNRSGSPVHAVANGASISLTYNSVGEAGNVTVTAASTPDNPSMFPGGSFSGSTNMVNGANAYASGFDHPYVTTYTYSVVDDLKAVSQAAGNVNGQPVSGQPSSYLYDGLRRLTSTTTPESGTVTNYYTTSGGATCSGDPSLPCRIQDARGVVRTLSYDGINRPSGVTYSDGTPSVTYQYDTGGSAAFALDRLTKIIEGSNSQTFTYDNLGRVTNVSHVIDGTTYPVQYAYNLSSQLSSTTYPTGRVVSADVDAIGRLSSLHDGSATYLSNLSYNAAGEPLGLSMGNGVQGAFNYNDHLQLSTLRYFKTGSSTEVLNLAYDYTTIAVPGNNGQIQAMHFYSSPGSEDQTKSENFTYDAWGRLSAAHTTTVNSTAGTWSLQWGYDRLGNRLSQTLLGGNLSVAQPNFTIDSATNRITNSGYTYDAAGNLTSDSVSSYGYDGANRMKQFNGTAASYAYFGPLRIKKVVASTTTVYIYSGNKPIVEYTNGTVSAENIYAGSRLLAVVTSSGTNYYHPDHLSTRAMTDGSGNIIRTSGTLPFGDTWYVNGLSTKWKYTTYERDGESGSVIDYAQFRYYYSTQGRFMSPDILGGRLRVPQSHNRYSYSLNDPVNMTDPLGLLYVPFDGFSCVTTYNVTTCEHNYYLVWFDEPSGGGYLGGGGDGESGGGGGGGGGGGQDRPLLPLNIKKLFDCIAAQFKVKLVAFVPSQPFIGPLAPGQDRATLNSHGLFIGTGSTYLGSPFTVENDNSTVTISGISQFLGVPADGVTLYSHPEVNFTASDAKDMLETQIFELGNSLAFLTGQVTLSDLHSGKVTTGSQVEPGKKLEDCYNKKSK